MTDPTPKERRDEPGQPAPRRFQPDPEDSRQSDDPLEPDELDVMAHNKPQTDGRGGASEPSYKEMREFARDDEEDLQGEQDLAEQLRQLDQDASDRR